VGRGVLRQCRNAPRAGGLIVCEVRIAASFRNPRLPSARPCCIQNDTRTGEVVSDKDTGYAVGVLNRIGLVTMIAVEHSQRRERGFSCCAILLALLAPTGLGATSPPPTSIAESLEWITRTSELIVVGRPISVYPDVVRTNDDRFDEDVTVKVERVLAGELNEASLTFRWRPDRRIYMKYWLELEKEPNVRFDFHMFFFLNRASSITDDGKPRWTMRADLFFQGSWKTAVGIKAETTSAIAAAIEGELAYMREHGISPLQLKADTFERTKTLAMASALAPPKGSVLVKISQHEYVVSPAYPPLQQDALDLCRATDMYERSRGALMLRSYPDSTSVGMLMSLLNDQDAYRWNMSVNTSCATYMVRAIAYDVLRDMGISTTKPVLDECHSR
jgi:hypothetical protein